MARFVLALALCAGLGFFGVTWACGPMKLTEKEMRAEMARVHRGEKSAYALLEKEATAKEPNWEEFAKHLRTVKMMSLHNTLYVEDEKQSRRQKMSDRYAEAVKGLDKAKTDKDAKLAAESFVNLQKSCVACHSYGGIALCDSEKELRKEKEKKGEAK